MTGDEKHQLGALTADVANLKHQIQEQGKLIQEMRDVIIASKGSWKTLVAIGGFLMALSSLITGLVLKFWPQGHS